MELVPAALYLGWAAVQRRPARKGQRRFGEFEFERVEPDRIEHMGFDFQYGDKPDVWLHIAVWTGEGGRCALFRTGSCWDHSQRKKPLWRSILDRIRREPASQDPTADAIANGLRRLQIAEAYLRGGVDHPDCGLVATLPPYRWPEGYAERVK